MLLRHPYGVLGISCLCLLLVIPVHALDLRPHPGEPTALNRADTDLVDDISRRSFRYFWEQTDTRTGLVADRALTTGEPEDTPRNVGVASIAATGFGLTAFCIAADHRWISRETARQRALATLR